MEDDEPVRRLVEALLARAGYVVATADTGECALAVFPGADPDVVLLDVKLPRMTGWEVLERLRESTLR